jgi:uncharacterized protein
MKINVCQLKKDRGASLSFCFRLEARAVLPDAPADGFVGEVTVEGQITNAGAGLLAEGRAAARLNDVCARCLKELTVEVTADFTQEFFAAGQRATDEFYSYKADFIDLKDLTAEVLLSARPLKSLCRSDCRGLCPVCGSDLNLKECGCAPPPASRLPALKNAKTN